MFVPLDWLETTAYPAVQRAWGDLRCLAMTERVTFGMRMIGGQRFIDIDDIAFPTKRVNRRTFAMLSQAAYDLNLAIDRMPGAGRWPDRLD